MQLSQVIVNCEGRMSAREMSEGRAGVRQVSQKKWDGRRGVKEKMKKSKKVGK